MKVLGIIPARAGSKGVPNKNIKQIDGASLLDYAVDVALKTTSIDKIVITSDSQEILNTISSNDKVHLDLRNPALATDTANIVDVCTELLNHFTDYDTVVLLQPTSPLRTSLDVEKALSIHQERNYEAVISMVAVEDHHPARMYREEDGKLESLHPDVESARRQDLEKLYIRNGCIYIINTEVLKKENTFMPRNKHAYLMLSQWAVNVDTPIDLELLKILMPLWKQQHDR